MVKPTPDSAGQPSSDPTMTDVRAAMARKAATLVMGRNAKAKADVSWSWRWGSRGVQLVVRISPTGSGSLPAKPE